MGCGCKERRDKIKLTIHQVYERGRKIKQDKVAKMRKASNDRKAK